MVREQLQDGPKPAIAQLDPVQLGRHFEVVQATIEPMVAQTEAVIAAAMQGRPVPEDGLHIDTEVRPDGVRQYTAAVARGIPHSQSALEFVEGPMVVARAKEQLSDLIMVGRHNGTEAIRLTNGRFREVVPRMKEEIFGLRYDGRGEEWYVKPVDYADGNEARSVLNQIEGRAWNDEVDLSKAQPLSETDVDELVTLMPAILAYSQYKIIWRGLWALRSALTLTEHIASEYPEKALEIDLDETTAMVGLMAAASRLDRERRAKITHYEYEKAERVEPAAMEILDHVARVVAQQNLTGE